MTITQLPSTEEGERSSGIECGNICRPQELARNMDVSGLVDAQTGLVDRAIFTDRRLYEQELSRVFATSWLFLGHVEQLQKPGDFFTTFMGEDPVIVTKDKEGRIRAYLNSCRHRGARVLRADYGQTRNFTCTYHGWSWDLGGELISVPNEDGYVNADFSRDQWGLVEVAQLDVACDLIFATWNPEAPPLDEQLGDMKYYMEAFLGRDPAGTTIVGGITKWVLKGNWKLAAEQFGTDWYHVNMSHASALMVLSPTGKGPKESIANTPGRQYSDERGNGTGFPTHPKSRFDAQPVHEYYDYDELRERLGQARVEGPLTTGHATVFPNFSYLPVNGSIRVWHPKGVDEMEIWSWTVLDKSMPEEVREAQRLYNLRTFGPSGIFEQDDGENWSEVQSISHGWRTNTVPLNYQMGLGTERNDGVYPGETSELYSDAAGRKFYSRWAELMNEPAWHEREEQAVRAAAPTSDAPPAPATPPAVQSAAGANAAVETVIKAAVEAGIKAAVGSGLGEAAPVAAPAKKAEAREDAPVAHAAGIDAGLLPEATVLPQPEGIEPDGDIPVAAPRPVLAPGKGIVVAHRGDVADGEGIRIDSSVLGTVDHVALFREGESYYAVDDTCTHEVASLSEGWVEGGCVECPLHAAKFDLCDGSAQAMPATVGIRTHEVSIDGDDIAITPNPAAIAGGSPDAAHDAEGHESAAEEAEEAAAHDPNAQDSILIVGAGLAGYNAAVQLRADGFVGAITVVDGEPASYDRPPLSKRLFDEDFSLDALAFEDEAALAEKHIATRFGSPVVSLDAERGEVRLADGTELSAGKVLLATGGRARPLDIPGATLPGVHTLTNFGDAWALRQAVSPGTRVAIIGGGLIGAELASALSKAGAEVTLVVRREPPLEHAIGALLATRLHAQHGERGIRVVAGDTIEFAQADGALAVRLADGSAVAADRIVVSVGSVPNLDVALAAGLEVADGVLVDRSYRTSAERVYAAGDVAQFRGEDGQPLPRAEHWEAAQFGGQDAARGILGRETPDRGAAWFWSDRHDCHLEAVGRLSGTGEVVVREGGAHPAVFLLEDGVLQGAAAIDDNNLVRAARRIIDQQIPVSAAELADPAVSLRSLLKAKR